MKLNFDCYKVFKELESLFQQKKWETYGGLYAYSQIVCKGENELSDYNRGYLCLHIEPYFNISTSKYCVHFYIVNIDDMMINGWSKDMSKEDSQLLADMIAKKFKDIRNLPTMKGLNKQLRNYGVFCVIE